MPQYRLSQHGLDIVFKLEAEQLGTALGRRFGIDLPPIVRHFPTELPMADVHLDQLDTMFELADDSLLHLECQTQHRRATLLRFFQYDSGLYVTHQRRIHTVVFYGAGITTAAEAFDGGAIQYRVHNVFLGRQDGEATYQELQAKLATGVGLTPEERLDLVFLPLMRHTRPPVDVVTGALTLARQLPEEEQRQVLASLIGLGKSFLDSQELDVLLEGLMTTGIGEMLLERGAIATKREYTLKTLERKFGAVPPQVSERLLQVGDSERLDALFDGAMSVDSLQEFAALLDQM